MQYFEHEISGIDGTAAKFVGYCLDNSEEVIPDYARPTVRPSRLQCSFLRPATTLSSCDIP